MKNSIVLAAAVSAGLLIASCEKSDMSSDHDASPGNPAPDAPSTPDEGFDSGTASEPDVLVAPDAGPDSGVSAPDLPVPTTLDGGLDGPSAPDAGIDGTGISTAIQYAMTASIAPVLVDGGYPGAPAPPSSHSFSLLVDWNARTAIIGAYRKAAQIGLLQTGESEWESTEPLAFNLGWWDGPSLTYSKLKLVRGRDGCSATASGSSTQIQGDIVYDVAITATMVGMPDKAGPQFSVVPSGEVHPLSFTGIVADELLPPGTTATIEAAGTSLALASAMSNGAPGVSAFSLPDKALAFGATHNLRVDPDAVDLVGNKTAALPSFATLPDPGLFAQDGFEGPIQAYMTGFAAVSSDTALPILAGATAVAVPPVDSINKCPARFTARLAVPTGATSVKFAFMLCRFKSGTFFVPPLYIFAVAVPNGAAVSTWDSQLKTTPLSKPWPGDPPGSDLYTYGDLLEAEMPLPPGTSGEVMFDVDRTCAEPGLPPPGIIIDSLRVE